ncbi:hypothetical protein [Thermomonas sp.]|jgi:hypothetical protein
MIEFYPQFNQFELALHDATALPAYVAIYGIDRAHPPVWLA